MCRFARAGALRQSVSDREDLQAGESARERLVSK